MAVSCICHECHKVKRCKLYTRQDGSNVEQSYLCRPCARSLGYRFKDKDVDLTPHMEEANDEHV